MTRLALDLRLDRPGHVLAARIDTALDGLTAVVGASGCGKTTLLRLIAGFERGTGSAAFAGRIWQGPGQFVPPHRRRVATVFQDARLFPHLDVAGNLAYAARRAGTLARLAATAERFGIGPLLSRPVAGLSGGEAQRVALARALLTGPALILMDEPLSALDPAARGQILPLIEALRDEGTAPILYVSHSRPEVARLAERAILIEGGRIAAFGPVAEVLGRAPDEGGADPLSILSGTVIGPEPDGLTAIATAGGRIFVAEASAAPGRTIRLAIRARDVMLARASAAELAGRVSAQNLLPGRVAAIAPRGASALVTLDCDGARLEAMVTARAVAALALEPGTDCLALVKSVALLGS